MARHIPPSYRTSPVAAWSSAQSVSGSIRPPTSFMTSIGLASGFHRIGTTAPSRYWPGDQDAAIPKHDRRHVTALTVHPVAVGPQELEAVEFVPTWQCAAIEGVDTPGQTGAE
jgi:hypothetical protein